MLVWSLGVVIVICVVAKAVAKVVAKVVAMVIGSCFALEVIIRCWYCNWVVIWNIQPNLLRILNFPTEKHYDDKIRINM